MPRKGKQAAESTDTSLRKSNRQPIASAKRKAADEGSSEQMKKKMKALEDKIASLVSTNDALTDTVRSMHKRVDGPRDEAAADGRGANDDPSDGSTDDDSDDSDSPMFFRAPKITVTKTSNPDAARQKRRQPVQDSPLHHRDGSPSPSQSPERVASDPIATPRNTSSGAHADANHPPSPEGSSSDASVDPTPPHPWPPAPIVDPNATPTTNRAYDKVVVGLLTDAQHRFECLVFVRDAYPDINKQVRWAYQCWEDVCVKHKSYYELSKDMLTSIKGRTSHGRGAVLHRIRPIIENLFDKNGKNKSAVSNNRALAVRYLTENAFYYVSGSIGDRRFEDPTMTRVIQLAFFNGPNSCAAMNRSRFNPIPLPALALVCTLYEHCLREWETGTNVAIPLNESVDAPRYRLHLANHTKWKGLNDKATSVVLKYLTRDAFGACGPKLKHVETIGPVSEKTLEQERALLKEMESYSTEEEV